MHEDRDKEEIEKINEEIEEEIMEMLAARERGEEYSFDEVEEESEEEIKKGRRHFFFLFTMTTILVIVVIFKIITMILRPLGLL